MAKQPQQSKTVVTRPTQETIDAGKRRAARNTKRQLNSVFKRSAITTKSEFRSVVKKARDVFGPEISQREALSLFAK